MKIAEPPRIRKPLPLTPLVDVVFLLLMFFMLTSSFTRFGNLGFDVGTAGTSTPAVDKTAKPGVIVRVLAGTRASVNGEPVEIGALPALLRSYRDRGVTAAAVQASSDASVQDLVAVVEALRASPLERIYMVK